MTAPYGRSSSFNSKRHPSTWRVLNWKSVQEFTYTYMHPYIFGGHGERNSLISLKIIVCTTSHVPFASLAKTIRSFCFFYSKIFFEYIVRTVVPHVVEAAIDVVTIFEQRIKTSKRNFIFYLKIECVQLCTINIDIIHIWIDSENTNIWILNIFTWNVKAK